MSLPGEIDHAKCWKYAKMETERRFLLQEKPGLLSQLSGKSITDRYLHSSRIRLRKVESPSRIQYKLTKKLVLDPTDLGRQWISTIYLSEAEYTLFTQLPAYELRKKRYAYHPSQGPPIGFDEIIIERNTLWIAEVEFPEGEEKNYAFPFSYVREISNEEVYSGFELARQNSASMGDL